MADRELRRMNRTELIEIIFALKQSEDALKTENAALTAQLEDRQIHLRHAGSIARASLELNHVFESAQAAADDYLASIQSILHEAQDIRVRARTEAQQILAQAQAEAEKLKADTEAECRALRAAAEPKEPPEGS